jgi:GGDEF domain-containing protein
MSTPQGDKKIREETNENFDLDFSNEGFVFDEEGYQEQEELNNQEEIQRRKTIELAILAAEQKLNPQEEAATLTEEERRERGYVPCTDTIAIYTMLAEMITQFGEQYQIEPTSEEHRKTLQAIHTATEQLSSLKKSIDLLTDEAARMQLLAIVETLESGQDTIRASEQQFQPDRLTNLEPAGAWKDALSAAFFTSLQTTVKDRGPSHLFQEQTPDDRVHSVAETIDEGKQDEEKYEYLQSLLEVGAHILYVECDGSGVKTSNDYGKHSTGDKYIGQFGAAFIQVQAALEKIYPEATIRVFRNGGDEFGLMMHDTTHKFTSITSEESTLDPFSITEEQLQDMSDGMRVKWLIYHHTKPVNQDVLTRKTFETYTEEKAEARLTAYAPNIQRQAKELIQTVREEIASKPDFSTAIQKHVQTYTDLTTRTKSAPLLENALLGAEVDIENEQQAIQEIAKATGKTIEEIRDDLNASYRTLLAQRRTLEQQAAEAKAAPEQVRNYIDSYYKQLNEKDPQAPAFSPWETYISVGVTTAQEAFQERVAHTKTDKFDPEKLFAQMGDLLAKEAKNVSQAEIQKTFKTVLYSLMGLVRDHADSRAYGDKTRIDGVLSTQGSTAAQFALRLKKGSRQ